LTTARDFPTRTVEFLVPFAAGGAVDGAARLFAAKLSTYWQQPVVVENRPGGSTTIASKQVGQARPDGHSLLFTLGDTFTVVPFLAQHRTFKPFEDLVPINLPAKIINAIVVNPGLPVKDLAGLIAYARQHPKELRYGSAGVGSNVHLTMEMLKAAAGIEIQHIPYRGSGPAVTATLANDVQITVAGYAARALIEGGKLRAIATAAAERLGAFPDIPTTIELGYPKVDSSSWFVVAAPTKTPPAILKAIDTDLGRALNDPELRRQITESYGHVITNIPEPAAIQWLRDSARTSAEAVHIAGADRE
jgi:tripartite-type tricarboxylate transporter receptor subunit TctC